MRCWPSLLAIMIASVTAKAGPYDSLLKVVPSTTNTLLLINTEAIYKTPAAQTLNWAKAYADRFRSGSASIPPDSKRIVIAGLTNTRSFERQWQLALATMQQVPNVRAVANREGGSVDTVADRPAALSPHQVYFTTLSEQESATWYPANRQLLAHWLRNVKANQERKDSPLSPYFQKVVNQYGENAHLVLSLDMTDALDVASIRFWLEESRSLTIKAGVNKDGLAKMIAQMQGITLAINVTDKLEATLKVDFAVDAEIHRTVLKDILLEAFEDEGLATGELASWETKFSGKTMTLTGSFEAERLGRLLSFFEFPQESDGSSAPKVGDKPSATATKKYFDAVLAAVEELRGMKDKKDYEKTATWHENYAKKIDQISTRSVDPIAIKFAQATSARIRAIAGSMRGVPIDVKTLASGAYAITSTSFIGNGRGWGGRGRGFGRGWGGGGVASDIDTNIPQTNAQINKVIADEAKNRTEAWSQIENSTVETRQKLNDAYGGGF